LVTSVQKAQTKSRRAVVSTECSNSHIKEFDPALFDVGVAAVTPGE
jgi:hypothetical protein